LSEKHLIKAVINREVPLGGLPSDVGVAMTNVATITSVARAVMRSIPLTHRVVSITGGGIVQPKNLLVPMGIPMGALIDFCGGLRKTAARMVAGGPMMGFAFTNLNTPVTKGTAHQAGHGIETQGDQPGENLQHHGLLRVRFMCPHLSSRPSAGTAHPHRQGSGGGMIHNPRFWCWVLRNF